MPPSFLCGSPDLQKGADSEEAHGSPDGRSTSEMKGGHGDLVQLLFSCNLPPVAAPCDTSQHTHVFVPDLKAGKSLSPNFFFFGGEAGGGGGGLPYSIWSSPAKDQIQAAASTYAAAALPDPFTQGAGPGTEPASQTSNQSPVPLQHSGNSCPHILKTKP